MTREDFVEYVKGTGLEYDDKPKGFGDDYDGIYIFGYESKLKKAHPRKYKNLYVPYLRVSNFSGDWYVRDNGWCHYAPPCVVMELVEKLKGR